MQHIYYDSSNDEVYRLRDGWYCIVDGREFGPRLNEGLARAEMATEQRRAEKRRLQRAKEAS